MLRKEFQTVDDTKKTERLQRRKDKDRERKTAKFVEDDESDQEEGWTEVGKEKQIQLFDPKQEVTHDAMINKIEEVMGSRGRLGTNRKQHVKQLQELYRISEEVSFR